MSNLTWTAVEREFRELFTRRYFANNGPLVQRLDAEFAREVSSAFAVACASDAVATAIAAKALAPRGGEVLVPAVIRPAIAQALAWAGLRLRRVDIEAHSFMMNLEAAQSLRSGATVALFDVALFGRRRTPGELSAFSPDTRLATLCDDSDRPWTTGARGYDACVVSLEYGLASGGALGATVLTDGEELAKQLRTMRNFHAGETFAEVPLRMNGKMSESQAALALVALAERSRLTRERSEGAVALQRALEGIGGVALVSEPGSPRMVLDVPPGRAETIVGRLRDRGIWAARPFALSPTNAEFPNAAELASRLIEVRVARDQVEQLAESAGLS